MEKSLKPKGSFSQRFLTTVVLGPLVIAMILWGQPFSYILCGIITIAALYEWIGLSRWQFSWLIGGFIYILLAMFSLSFYLLNDQKFFLALLLTSWITDISAYLVGSKLQGPKLAPKISPGKTWSGSLGGLLIGTPFSMMLFSYAMSKKIPLESIDRSFSTFLTGTLNFLKTHTLLMFALSFFLIIIAQAGDLLESLAKRHFGVKDSGRLLPGHGGLLDRIDSLLAMGFMLFFYLLIKGISKII